ncbi:MAG TPA: glycine--tRNA ligase subunit beta [Bacillales bacterium]|nr:glycine--tRNA ligase subunit beta [Bacillales bacterium]
MSKEDLLIEVGLEEMPAPFVTNAMEQLKEKTVDWLNEEQIQYDSAKAFSTPRRLAVFVSGVADQQTDREEEARGPAKKIAVDEEGNWSKAAQGFARGQGVSIDDLYVKQIKGKEYVFANKFLKGRQTIDLLPEIQQLITSMTFPKSMRWGPNDLRFVRPIRWLAALYGDEVVPFSITGVRSGRITYGHRFLGDKTALTSSTGYMETLLGQFVIADPQERKSAIRDQLNTLAEDEGWHIPIDEGLLEEVNNLVEYPTALYGTFDEAFLKLPKEVLLISMREHQRYFPVENEKGDLLPFFVTIRNGDHKHLDKVAKGNEKVLRARLSDAVFFYNEDQKMTISDALSRLEHVVFQEKLGTMNDKTGRVRKLAGKLASKLEMDDKAGKEVDRAAEICKFDLVTHMVDEFSELQGVMGEKYALIAGESEGVAKAVNEHYQPRFKGDQLPASDMGAIVGIADKLDTIVGCFAIGLIPSGSQDPYGLRRNASGIVQILLDRGWRISVEKLLDMSLEVYEKSGLVQSGDRMEIEESLLGFFRIRLKTVLQDRNIPYDVIDAVLPKEIGSVGYLVSRAELLTEKRNDPDFKALVEALSRVTNIAAKADLNNENVDPSLFENDKETQLYKAAGKADEQVSEAAAEKDPSKAYQALSTLSEPIHLYFDDIMVMSENENLRNNRLSQMSALSKVIRSFADFNLMVL